MKLFKRAENPLETTCKTQEEKLQKQAQRIAELEALLQEEREEKSKLYNQLQISETKLKKSQEEARKLRSEMQEYRKNYEDLHTLFGYENQNLKFALLDLQQNMANATGRAKESLKTSKTVEDNFDKAFSEINMIVDKLDDLINRSNTIAGVIKTLSQKAREIEKSVEMINEVVMQIKILSLNASVEAASAGEAGKGFAVVATEVKNLANKTSAVATEINKIVKSIQQSTENTGQEFQQIDKNIQVIYENTNNFSKEIHSLDKLTKHSLSELNILGDSVFMSLAKLDHVLWKVNTYISVHEGKPAFKFVDHHNCRLGKWYFEGDGEKYFSHTKSYAKLDKPHSGVHNGTHKIFELIAQKPIDLAAVKQAFETIEGSSKEVFAVLSEIMEEVLAEEGDA